MQLRLKTILGATAAMAVLAGAIVAVGPQTAAAQGPAAPPKYRFDPSWPKLPYPHNWAIKSFGGIFIDKNDNIWVLSRPEQIPKADLIAELKVPEATCCFTGPAVIEFSPKGDILQAWGGQGYVPGWPQQEQGIVVDGKGHVWIGGAKAGDTLMEFTADGMLVRDFGHRGPTPPPKAPRQKEDNQQTALLMGGEPAEAIDDAAHEIYVTDGYLNKRVLVFDIDTGAFKRGWGGYGKPLAEISNDPAPDYIANQAPSKEFMGPIHGIKISNDGLVYVSDRGADRVQVFTKQGKFVQEIFIDPQTIGHGSVDSVAFSGDPGQKYLYAASFQNSNVEIYDRKTGKLLDSFGSHGTNGGQFTNLHIAAVDSHGNVYAGEVGDASRIQKFTPVATKK